MDIFKKGHLSQNEITDWLIALRGRPYPRVSHFDVTAIFRARLGDEEDYYFAGVNVENPDHRLSTHGEEGAIAAMITGGGKNAEVVEGWVMGAPRDLTTDSIHPLADNLVTCCGKCRQQIASLATPDTKIHSASLKGHIKTTTVGDFLPDAFTIKQVKKEETIQKKKTVPCTVADIKNRIYRENITLSEKEIFDWLKNLESIDTITGVSHAVILQLENGTYTAGTSMEEIAFLSMNAVQSAVAVSHAAFGPQKIKQLWGLTTSPNTTLEDFTPLTGAAVQVTAEHTKNNNIPITLFNGNGNTLSMALNKTSEYIPTFDSPFIKKK